MQYVFDVADEGQAERADDDAGGEVAEHRAESQPATQRHADDGGEQEDQRLREQAQVGFSNRIRLH
jgi:hypothetical protein